MLKLLTLLSIVIVSQILCLCPPLSKPNPNVVVTCKNVRTSQADFKCTKSIHNSNSINNKTQPAIESGTIATYKCDKYFQPTNKRHGNVGILNCTDDTDQWTNERAFRNFRCEIDCGKQPALTNTLIKLGNSTEISTWPWIATIFRETQEGKFEYSCGGTLIGQKTILTAAHCLVDARLNKLPTNVFRIFVSAISSNFDENLRQRSAQMHFVKTMHINPDFRVSSFTGDVAIIELTEAVKISDSLLPICLPRSYEHDAIAITTGNIGDVTSNISSFGVDETGSVAKTLRHAQIPIISRARCNDVLNRTTQGDQFCAGNPSGPNICVGDSGSGLVFKSAQWNEEKYSIHAVVSNTGVLYSDGCSPMAVFTKAFSYISWIQDQLIASEGLLYIKDVTLRKQKKLYTKLERKALGEVISLHYLRPMVKTFLLEDYMVNDDYLIRFLRSKNLNVNQAKLMLQATMQWRKTNRVDRILNENFTQLRKNYPVFHQGFDKLGRPVFTRWWGLWSNIVHNVNPNHFWRYLLRNCEMEAKIIRAIGLRNITQAISISDWHGVTVDNLDPMRVRRISKIFQIYDDYYPQHIFRHYIINVPRVAERVVDSIRLYMSVRSVNIVHFFGTNKTEWSQEY